MNSDDLAAHLQVASLIVDDEVHLPTEASLTSPLIIAI